jgi:hypothetical protein
MTVKTTDIILAMLTYLPFLKGSFVAIPANFRCDGQGHYSAFFRMSFTHDTMAGLTSDTGV